MKVDRFPVIAEGKWSKALIRCKVTKSGSIDERTRFFAGETTGGEKANVQGMHPAFRDAVCGIMLIVMLSGASCLDGKERR